MNNVEGGYHAQETINREGLEQIKRNTDWRTVFTALGLKRASGKGNDNDWWANSPFSEDQTPSFHISNDPSTGEGRWFCFATNQGGSLVDLVCKLQGGTVYDAGRWLLENQCSTLGASAPVSQDSKGADRPREKRREKKKEGGEGRSYNKPIRQSLLHALTEKGTHPAFTDRGISEATCEYLGCGFLPETHSGQLSNRIVFQIRGVDAIKAETPKPVILSHIGRAVDEALGGDKWYHYKGFKKTLELFNLDQVLLDEEARDQIEQTHKIWLVEGCFDAAKLIEAGIKNVVSTFGANLAVGQIEKLESLSHRFPKAHIGVWFDRDEAGTVGQRKAIEALKAYELDTIGFDWNQGFTGSNRIITLPATLNDPADFSVRQLRWLRKQGIT